MTNNNGELEKFERSIFGIHKYLLTLSVTVFGASIALAIDKNVNLLFFIGEFLIFISIILGLLLVLSYGKVKEFDYILDLKNDIKGSNSELMNSCEKILNKNQSGFLYFVFKKIKYERLFSIFVWTLIFGLFFIMLSLINFRNKDIQQYFLILKQ